MSASTNDPSSRRSYHHGDLYMALVDAGVKLAREGGPQAIVLREATRRAGVAPNAAYRHFANREALFEAVRMQVLSTMARTIEAQLESARRITDAAQRARAMLAAVGRGYLEFAQAETGWFRTAFAVSDLERDALTAQTLPLQPRSSGADPFEQLAEALDAMVDAHVLAASHRAQAEYLAWSAVHGMATLMIDGPLRQSTPEQRTALTERLLLMVEKGL
ncbi:TetR/AcrR family transcriptional regulator [Diaphorobacter caeni]|uniref:TetR/AcrR family transcriptional regulator n=1 Tax=Diaphorobacter caeni TaxID=2784387 RepID=UPI00188ECDCE|nr:TetR/AcrR family transcriptional regulator [Diaphorobacter caeni]MBF5005135.1 TetR/AcrR family transcriptional regulator [Diaphorobacter caeni]